MPFRYLLRTSANSGEPATRAAKAGAAGRASGHGGRAGRATTGSAPPRILLPALARRYRRPSGRAIHGRRRVRERTSPPGPPATLTRRHPGRTLHPPGATSGAPVRPAHHEEGQQMAAAKVFIFAPADETGETHRRLEEAGCALTLGKAGWHTPQGNNEDEMRELARDADALAGTSIRSSPITRGIMEASNKLRIVAKYTIGVDDVDVDAATELGILVTHGPTESNWGGVAEGTIANMLCILKKLRERDRHLKSGGEWRTPELTGTYLGARTEGARADGYQGLTIGIVGMGRVGTRVAELLRPWRVRVLACDPYIPEAHFAEH